MISPLLKFYKFFFLTLLLFTTKSFAKGPSPYLPLQTDPLIEVELYRLATLAKLPILTKPYHAATVNKYLTKITDDYPVLYKRIRTYLKRYKKQAGLIHASAQVNFANTDDMPLANARGQMTGDHYQIALSGFWQANQYLIFNGGGIYSKENDFLRTNTFVSIGTDVLQVDIGYKELWMSPFQEAAVLLSTQAKPALGVTISNSTLITDYNIKYEMSLSILDEHDEIKFDRDKPAVSGEPALLTMHLSFQPYEWWTIGFNRTLMFGGDEKVGLKDIWNAIIDPVNNDNCGGEGTELQDCSEEFGNQQASITNKFEVNWFDLPMSLYYEYAGEDTNNYTNYKLANLANSLGIFIPYLTENIALNIELTDFQSAWYTHHIYGEGYSNDGVKMGHWWGTRKDPKDSVGGEAASVRVDWQNNLESQITFLYRTANFNNSSFADYQPSHELEIKYTRAINSGFLGLKLYLGKSSYGDNFVQTGVSYYW